MLIFQREDLEVKGMEQKLPTKKHQKNLRKCRCRFGGNAKQNASKQSANAKAVFLQCSSMAADRSGT